MPIGPNALKIYAGRLEVYSSHFPFVILRAKQIDRMIVNRNDAGQIALSVDILDSESKVIVTFEEGHFIVNQSNILDMQRPDISTLLIRDQYKNEVLHIQYLNKRSLKVSGVLHYKDVGEIQIPEDGSVNGLCSGESHVALNIR